MPIYDPTQDERLDPRQIPMLEFMGMLTRNEGDIADRAALLAEANSAEALERNAMFAGADDLLNAPAEGLRSASFAFTSSPDGNQIQVSFIRPDTDDILPCIYYLHGGGLMVMSCFGSVHQNWGRLLAHQGLAVAMIDFRNCVSPSTAPEVAPFPAGLNDCVSGFLWTHENAEMLGIDPARLLIAGESGGGNLAIATTLKLQQLGEGAKQLGLYAIAPYIAGRWPDPRYPSSSENDGIFIHVGNNRGAIAYGIEALEREDPLAWPAFATETDLQGFPPTMISVNECDPLRDEGISFYRKLLRAGARAQCRQVMGTVHAAEMMTSLNPDISRTTARDVVGWIDECIRLRETG